MCYPAMICVTRWYIQKEWSPTRQLLHLKTKEGVGVTKDSFPYWMNSECRLRMLIGAAEKWKCEMCSACLATNTSSGAEAAVGTHPCSERVTGVVYDDTPWGDWFWHCFGKDITLLIHLPNWQMRYLSHRLLPWEESRAFSAMFNLCCFLPRGEFVVSISCIFVHFRGSTPSLWCSGCLKIGSSWTSHLCCTNEKPWLSSGTRSSPAGQGHIYHLQGRDLSTHVGEKSGHHLEKNEMRRGTHKLSQGGGRAAGPSNKSHLLHVVFLFCFVAELPTSVPGVTPWVSVGTGGTCVSLWAGSWCLCVHRWADLEHPKRANNSWTSPCHVHTVWCVGWEEMWGSVSGAGTFSAAQVSVLHWGHCAHLSLRQSLCQCSPTPGCAPAPLHSPCSAQGSTHLSLCLVSASGGFDPQRGLCAGCLVVTWCVQCLSQRHKSGFCLGA